MGTYVPVHAINTLNCLCQNGRIAKVDGVVQRIRHIWGGSRAAHKLAVPLPPQERVLRQLGDEQVQQLQHRLVHDDKKSANVAQMEEGEEGHPIRHQLEDVVQLVAEGGVVAVEEDLQELDDHDEGHHGHLEGFGEEMIEGLAAGADDDAPGRGVVGSGGKNLPRGHCNTANISEEDLFLYETACLYIYEDAHLYTDKHAVLV